MIVIESQVHRFWPETKSHPEIRVQEGRNEFPDNASEETKSALGRLIAAGLARLVPPDAPAGDAPKGEASAAPASPPAPEPAATPAESKPDGGYGSDARAARPPKGKGAAPAGDAPKG